MTEAWQIPIIRSALEFLFETGRFLMDEIRARRQEARTHLNHDDDDEVEPQPDDYSTALVISTHEQALNTMIDETLAQQQVAEIEHLIKLAATYTENYRLARQQYAAWGRSLVPPIIVHQLEEAEENLIQINRQLKFILEKALRRHINFGIYE